MVNVPVAVLMYTFVTGFGVGALVTVCTNIFLQAKKYEGIDG